MRMNVAHVLMYSRQGCHLCDEAREVIEALRAQGPFEFEEVFIDGNDDLERDYGVRLPVVLVDGREEFEYRVEGEALRGLLTRR